MRQAEVAPGADGRASPFVPGPRAVREPTGPGGLSGLTFAVKDVFDVAGFATTYGSRDWARTHPPPAADATAVLDLLGPARGSSARPRRWSWRAACPARTRGTARR